MQAATRREFSSERRTPKEVLIRRNLLYERQFNKTEDTIVDYLTRMRLSGGTEAIDSMSNITGSRGGWEVEAGSNYRLTTPQSGQRAAPAWSRLSMRQWKRLRASPDTWLAGTLRQRHHNWTATSHVMQGCLCL